MGSTKEAKETRGAGRQRGNQQGGRQRAERDEDSWVDAVVTLLATIVFGLGWVLVELERADPPPNRYDAAISTSWTTAVTSSIQARAIQARAIQAQAIQPRAANRAPTEERGDEDARWTKLAQRNSNR